MSQQAITSFVVRFHKNPIIDENSPHYRIKVTHVQQEEEITFESLEDVFRYMKDHVDRAEEQS